MVLQTIHLFMVVAALKTNTIVLQKHLQSFISMRLRKIFIFYLCNFILFHIFILVFFYVFFSGKF